MGGVCQLTDYSGTPEIIHFNTDDTFYSTAFIWGGYNAKGWYMRCYVIVWVVYFLNLTLGFFKIRQWLPNLESIVLNSYLTLT